MRARLALAVTGPLALGLFALLGAAPIVSAGSAAALAGSAVPAGYRPAFPQLKMTIPVNNSTGSAGYVSEQAALKTVSVTFEVPEITNCKATSNSGLGPVVILSGKGYFVGAGAEAECQQGSTSYLVAVNHNGNEAHFLTIQAKDKISVSITIASTVTVTIKDLTTKQTASQSVPKGNITAAELGDDSLSQGGHQVPIPNFTDHQFSKAYINGKPLIKATPLFEEVLVKGKTVLIKPGPITQGGTSFLMIFKHAT